MAGMDDYLDDTSYTGDSSEGGGQHMSLKDQGEGFYGRVTGNQDKKFGDHDATKAAKQKNAANGLLGGEKNALGGNGSGITSDGMDGARQGENNVASGSASDNATSGFKNKVTGATGGKAKGKGGFKGMLKKSMPMIIAGGGICGFGAVSFLGQMAMPFSLISQLQGNFDSMGTSSYMRAKTLTRMQMHPTTREWHDNTQKFVKKHSKIYSWVKGGSTNYFKLSKRQIGKLAKKGIQVKTDGGSQRMFFKNPDGTTTEIVADKSMAGGNKVYIEDAYAENGDFREAYFEGTKTWRQSLRAWFDKICTKFLSRIGIKRNSFKSFKNSNQVGKTEADIEGRVKGVVGNGDEGAHAATEGYGTSHEKVDTSNPPDGIPDTEIERDHNYHDAGGKLGLQNGMSVAGVSQKVSTFMKGVAKKMRHLNRRAFALTKFICVGAEIVNAVTILVIASEVYQVLKMASTLFSGIQQGQVEGSENSPLNNIATDLTTKRTSKYFSKGDMDNDENMSVDETVYEEKYGSAMEAEAVTSLYGNTRTDQNDDSVKSFILTDGVKNIFSAIAVDITAYKACLMSKIGSAVIDLIADIVDFAGWGLDLVTCIAGATATFGGSCAKLLGRIAIQTAKKAIFTQFVSDVLGMVARELLPIITSVFTRDLTKDIGGVDLGNALVSGGHIYQARNHQGGGGSPTSKDKYVAYLKEHEEYIADVSRYEREHRSPFDASSPYTFMGNLLSRSIPVLVGTSSVFGGINNVITVTGKAFSSLMPGASAVTAATTAQEAVDHTAQNCPDLDSIGAVGDVFCNPYRITDPGTTEEDPADVVYEVCQLGHNFEGIDPDKCDEADSGEDTMVPTINTKMTRGDDSSRLMEYIIYCGQRDSPFGMTDMNIANMIKTPETGGISKISSALSTLPFWGGIADIMQSEAVVKRIGYVTGESCIARETSSDDDNLGDLAFTWDEAKYYQRFIEDQRYLESAGLVDKSAVTVALEKYYEQNPVDTSEQGILARLSGMTKDDVIATEEIMQVLAWMNGYDPSTITMRNKYDLPEEKDEKIEIKNDDVINLDEYDTVDDESWKYSFRMQYNIG